MFANILLVVLMVVGSFSSIAFGSDLSGTLLATDGWSNTAWAHGNLIMRDLKTGQVDTLVKGKIGGAVFSPNGRKVAYYSETSKFNIIDIKTRQIEPLSFTGDGDQISWTQDSIIYFVTSKYICRYNINSRHIDTVHMVIGDYSHDKDTTNYYVTEGNVANSGERAAFISTKGGNHVLSIQIGGTEVMMNDGVPSTRTSCQGGI
jgi:hypothetical protein